jgi:hypothetical protein
MRGARTCRAETSRGRARIRHRATLRAAIGDDLRAPARERDQHAVIEGQVDLGPRRQRRPLLQKLHRLEEQMRRAIASGALELEPHARVLATHAGRVPRPDDLIDAAPNDPSY